MSMMTKATNPGHEKVLAVHVRIVPRPNPRIDVPVVDALPLELSDHV